MESYFLSYTHTRKVIYNSSKLSNYSHHRLQRHKLDQQNPGHRSKTDGKDEDEDDEGGKWKPAQLRHNGIFGLLETEERAHASCGEADEQGGDQEKNAAARSSVRHSGLHGPSSLQWQKCQLTLLFTRQPGSNRELRNKLQDE